MLAMQSIEGMYHAHFDPRELLFHVFRGQTNTEARNGRIAWHCTRPGD